jgi:hypothetical protein
MSIIDIKLASWMREEKGSFLFSISKALIQNSFLYHKVMLFKVYYK